MSKKSNKLPFILFLPVSVGIALIISGIVTQRDELLFAGICVLFGGSFAVAIIVTFITIALSSSRKTPTDQSNESSTANDFISEARRRVDERTGGPSSETRAALDKISESMQKRKRKDSIAKFFAALFIIAFIGCGIVGVALMTNELMAAGGIVFG
ncbi:MAG: hypothetical protein K2M48_02895, partial [Clostridiales bacterium]|nr:hypothetical protein [Clostridiales bacterium]